MPYHWRRFCVLWNCCLHRLVLFIARIILKLNLSADPWRGPGPLPLPISSFETQQWTNYCPIHFFPRIFCLTIFKASLCSPNTFLTTCKLKAESYRSYSFRSVYLSLHCFTYNFDLFFDGNLDRSLTLGDTSCKVRSQIQIALKSLDPYLKTKWAFRQFHWLTAINLITFDMIQKQDITFCVNG